MKHGKHITLNFSCRKILQLKTSAAAPPFSLLSWAFIQSEFWCRVEVGQLRRSWAKTPLIWAWCRLQTNHRKLLFFYPRKYKKSFSNAENQDEQVVGKISQQMHLVGLLSHRLYGLSWTHLLPLMSSTSCVWSVQQIKFINHKLLFHQDLFVTYQFLHWFNEYEIVKWKKKKVNFFTRSLCKKLHLLLLLHCSGTLLFGRKTLWIQDRCINM